MSDKPRLLVVSAPSGCGKGTILSEVFRDREVFYSVSCTTRKPRPGEREDIDYHYISDSKFGEMIENNEFLEYACYADHSYGTPAAPVRENLAQGRNVVLEIETDGAFQVKKAMPEAVLIFILPPSVAELDRRLHKRNTEPEEVIRKRVAQAAAEIAKAVDYDYVIMNDALEEAVADFTAVLDGGAERFRAANTDVKKMINEVLENA